MGLHRGSLHAFVVGDEPLENGADSRRIVARIAGRQGGNLGFTQDRRQRDILSRNPSRLFPRHGEGEGCPADEGSPF